MGEINKVMFLIDSYENPYAGTEGQLLELIKGLISRGVEVHLTLLRPSRYIESHPFPCDVSVLEIYSLRSISVIKRLTGFARKTKENGFSLVHIFFNDSSIVSPVFLSMYGIKVIVSRRDMGFWYSPANKLLLRLNRFFIDAVVANSRAVMEITRDAEWVEEDRLHVIYNGYKELDENLPIHSSDLSSELPLGKKLVTVVANIRPIKRVTDLIDSAAILNRADIAYLIVGDGDTRMLEEYAETKGVSEQVFVLGQRDDVPNILSISDITILCSESEGFSNSIIEYMLAGKPVICTRAGGNPELVVDGKNGFLYEVGDVERLAELISTLTENGALARELGSEGQSHVLKKFGVDKMVDEHLQLYRCLLNH